MEAAVIVIPQDEQFRKQFTALLEMGLSEIDSLLGAKRVVPSKAKQARYYFEALRKSTIRDSSSFFREEPNAPSWLLADH
jgi:hypothetical protein